MNNFFNNHTICLDVTNTILNLLDYKSLNALRGLNTTWKHYIDQSNRYLVPQNAIKNKFIELVNQEESLQQKLDDRKACFRGYFAFKVNCHSKFTSLITDFFCKLFLEITKQNKIIKEVDILNIERANILSKYRALEKMISLFGDEEYAALPILDLGDREGATDYIDFIEPEEMTAPIMKGQDKSGRHFIALRLIYRRYMSCLTYFEREKHSFSCEWTQAGDGVRYLPSRSVIYNEKTQDGRTIAKENEEAFAALAKFIKNRGNDKVKIA